MAKVRDYQHDLTMFNAKIAELHGELDALPKDAARERLEGEQETIPDWIRRLAREEVAKAKDEDSGVFLVGWPTKLQEIAEGMANAKPIQGGIFVTDEQKDRIAELWCKCKERKSCQDVPEGGCGITGAMFKVLREAHLIP